MDDKTIAMVIGLMLVAIGGILLLIALMCCLFKRRIDELQHDLEQLKHDSQSNTNGLRTVTCAVAELEKRMEDEPSHESKRMAASPERREAGGRNDAWQPV